MPTTFNVFFLGNTTDIDPVENNFVAENASTLVGSSFGTAGNPLYANIHSLSPGSTGFTGGTGTESLAYNQDNSPAEAFRLDGGADQTFDSSTIYNATLTYTDGTTDTITAVIFQDVDGNVYLAPENGYGADQIKLEAKPIQSINLGSIVTNNFVGLVGDRATGNFLTCYLNGTRILTPNGEVQIEDLCVADHVVTLDCREKPDAPNDGYNVIRWIGSTKISTLELAANPKLRPVRILAGALGNNLPKRDLLISQQHRMVVSSPIANRMFDGDVLVPAIKLTDLPGIYIDESITELEYFHLLFDKHEIIIAESAPSESLYTGPEALKAVSPEARLEILTLFPELENDEYNFEPALVFPERKKMKKLIERHRTNHASLLKL